MATYMELASDNQWLQICSEFGATKESLKKDVADLKEWIQKQPHLPSITDEVFLEHFLIRCKNSVEKTKKYLELYYINRAVMSDIYQNRNPSSKELVDYMKAVGVLPLPKLTPEGYRVFVYKLSDEIQNLQLKAEVFLELMTILMDYSLTKDRNRSIIHIFDLGYTTAAFTTHIISVLKRYITFTTRNCPIRIHKVYIMNLNSAFGTVVTTAKSFVKNKIGDRIEIWTKKPTDLVEVLPASVLPSDFGGNEKSIAELTEMFCTSLKEFGKWIESERQVAADLSKKPDFDLSASLDTVGEYGVDGSFRKIAVD